MTVVKKEYSGLKIPKSALRVVNSKRGVYVLTGMQVKFVEVNVIYSDDDYMICEKQTEDEKVLRLYDEVIVKGEKIFMMEKLSAEEFDRNLEEVQKDLKRRFEKSGRSEDEVTLLAATKTVDPDTVNYAIDKGHKIRRRKPRAGTAFKI